jgi:hypothetical protein
MAISVPVNARMMINGKKFCFAKFLDQTTAERIQNPDAICGNRDPLLDRTIPGRRKVMFTTFHDFTVPILAELLPLAGTTLSGSTYTANQTISSTTIVVDKVAKIHQYNTCRMNRMIMRGQVGTLPCSIECQWVAVDEVDGSAASWVDGTRDGIFGFPGSTYEIDGTEIDFDRFAFVIDNKLIPSWNASYTLTDAGAGPRQTLLATSIPYIAANEGLYWDNRDAITAGTDHSLSLTNGEDTVQINLPNTVLIPESPSIEGALEEIRLPMTWEAHRVGGGSPVAAFNIVVTNT